MQLSVTGDLTNEPAVNCQNKSGAFFTPAGAEIKQNNNFSDALRNSTTYYEDQQSALNQIHTYLLPLRDLERKLMRLLQAHEYMTSAELGRTFQVDHPDDGELNIPEVKKEKRIQRSGSQLKCLET